MKSCLTDLVRMAPRRSSSELSWRLPRVRASRLASTAWRESLLGTPGFRPAVPGTEGAAVAIVLGAIATAVAAAADWGTLALKEVLLAELGMLIDRMAMVDFGCTATISSRGARELSLLQGDLYKPENQGRFLSIHPSRRAHTPPLC